MPQMIAKRAMYYGGPRRAGDRFEATDVHALVLSSRGQAERATEAPAEAAVEQPALEQSAGRGRRRYKRRDLRAEA